MAKAREIPGLSTELAYGEVAARVLEVRCREMIDHSENVLDVSDIDRVHAMRVASRRLRAALEVFWPCFPKKKAKAVLAEIKGLADALGERRDRDVAIRMLGSFSEAMPHPDRRGIASLIEEFEVEQLEANDALAGPVEPERLARIEAAVHELAAAAREAAGAAPPATIATSNGDGGSAAGAP
ncbi:MAG: CHAD domain-containing protein [Solirubrobacterales bacterium]